MMDVTIYPALVGIERIVPDHTISIVIDVLRASTTILCLMENGLDRLQIVSTVEEALQKKKDNVILIGERGEKPLDGFEYDNSPFLVANRDWGGKSVILTTTNGTRAIASVQACRQVLIAGFRNIDSVASYVHTAGCSVAVIPIGNQGDPRLEDDICADALRKRINGIPVDWENILQPIWEERIKKIYSRSEAYKKDVELALTINATSIIPVLGKGLVLQKTIWNNVNRG
jgi:2-phosphosulfolactate phosphatase